MRIKLKGGNSVYIVKGDRALPTTITHLLLRPITSYKLIRDL